jgi:glutamyl-tRNA synthetase
VPDEDISDFIKRLALENALAHEGKANFKAVMSKVMAGRPELRSKAKEVMPQIKELVNDVNKSPIEDQRAMLEALGGPSTIDKVEERQGLPPLENVKAPVVMRFAPGPSGPLHLGHTRAAILNDAYCRMYDGKFVNRIEDTDPDRIMPEAYDWIPEDLEWLGVKVGIQVVQSERFELYYEHAERLLEMGHAYVCKCKAEDWRKLKLKQTPCPHRERPPEEQLEEWARMKDGTYAQEEAVMVVKTDLGHPNPAIRDWAALRICETPHPRTGDRYRVYPLMNFSVTMDDHLLGLTHVLRGKDHLNNTYRQEYVYDYFGWKKPEYIHYGRVSIEGPELSSSKMKAGIEEGLFKGWDDPRLGTIRALAKRGIEPEAIRKYWVDTGPKQVDIKFSWKTLFSYNKDIVDPKANRYFFVQDPRSLTIEGAEELVGRAPLHPSDPSKGHREVTVNGKDGVLLAARDLDDISPGEVVRLKDLGNVELISEGRAKYIGNDLSVLKQGARIIQWVHPTQNLEAQVQMTDGGTMTGRCELATMDSAGDMVQFERVGFVRIQERDGKILGWYAHR